MTRTPGSRSSTVSAVARTDGATGRKAFWRKPEVLLLVGSLLACCFLLEGTVLVVLGEQPKFPRHVVSAPFGLRINEPHAHYRHKSADVTVWFDINGQGMRSERDFSYRKPEGVLRIVSLGDSFTMGYEVSAEDCFSSVLERALKGQGDVEVLNAGVSGYGTAEECLYLERELLRYGPDLVLVSFYGNDLADNVRTGLFLVEGSKLKEAAQSYVPGGRLGDFLNKNWLLGLLSERSNAFALLKETATHVAKRGMVAKNIQQLSAAEQAEPPAVRSGAVAYERRLAAEIFRRMVSTTRRAGIPLLIQSIPTYVPDPPRLLEMFPLEEFDPRAEGAYFVAAKSVLEEDVGRSPLYHERSHLHWTPLAHQRAGTALAELIIREKLLAGGSREGSPQRGSAPARGLIPPSVP